MSVEYSAKDRVKMMKVGEGGRTETPGRVLCAKRVISMRIDKITDGLVRRLYHKTH
jgi:hypothetical protein